MWSAGPGRVGPGADGLRHRHPGAGGLGRRGVADAIHHHFEDQVLVSRMTGARALIIAQEGGDIDGAFTALVELTYTVFHAGDHHMLADNEA